MIMKTRTLEDAGKIARLHLIRMVAEAVLGSSYAPRIGAPTFVPAGLGSTLRLKPAAAGEAELAARVERYDLLGSDTGAARRARADLRARAGSAAVTRGQAEQNQAWLQAQGRRDRNPGAHVYLVRVPALHVRTQEGYVLTVPKQQLELLARGGTYAAVRAESRLPVRLSDGRWHWETRTAAAVREAWSALAESLSVKVSVTLVESEAA